jgi:hypothetical protein
VCGKAPLMCVRGEVYADSAWQPRAASVARAAAAAELDSERAADGSSASASL